MNKRTITIPAKIFDGESFLDLLKFHNAQDLSDMMLRELESAGKLDLKVTVTWPHWRQATQDWGWPETINNRLGPIGFELFSEFTDLYEESLKFINQTLEAEENQSLQTKIADRNTASLKDEFPNQG